LYISISCPPERSPTAQRPNGLILINIIIIIETMETVGRSGKGCGGRCRGNTCRYLQRRYQRVCESRVVSSALCKQPANLY
jgi:hypothetical protein